MHDAFAGRAAVVTGASSGIGRAVARELGRRGVRVALVARRAGELAILASQLIDEGAPDPVVLVADLSRRGEAVRVAGEAEARLGRVDLLVNNAAVQIFATVCAGSDGPEARALLETNYHSPLALMAALVPSMIARGEGTVVNVSSIAATLPPPMSSHYAASKGALALATEALAMELRGTGVHAMLVLPGPVDTEMHAEGRVIAAELLDGAPCVSAEHLARAVVRGIERRRAVLVHPRWCWPARHLPTLALLIARRAFAAIRIEPTRVIQAGSRGAPEVRAARAGLLVAAGNAMAAPGAR